MHITYILIICFNFWFLLNILCKQQTIHDWRRRRKRSFVNVSCALDLRSVSPLWCLSAYRSWAAQTSSSSTRALRSTARTTAMCSCQSNYYATTRDVRVIRGIFRLSTGQFPSTPARDTVRLLLCCCRIFGQQTSPDLNPVEWGWLGLQDLERCPTAIVAYQSRLHDTGELKQCVQHCQCNWRVAQASRACLQANGGHLEHML